MYSHTTGTKRIHLSIICKIDRYEYCKEKTIELKNYPQPTVKDLFGPIYEIHPMNENCRLFARYKKDEFIQVFDYMSMIAAFQLMDLNRSNYMYLVERNHRRPPIDPHLSKFCLDPCDIKIMCKYSAKHKFEADSSWLNPEHKPLGSRKSLGVSPFPKKSNLESKRNRASDDVLLYL